MKSDYDFSKGIKNPYIGKMQSGYSVKIHFDCQRQGSPKKGEEETRAETESDAKVGAV